MRSRPTQDVLTSSAPPRALHPCRNSLPTRFPPSSCPLPFRTCMVTFRSSTNTSFVRKSAPMVALYWMENLRLTYWFMSEVLPTLRVWAADTHKNKTYAIAQRERRASCSARLRVRSAFHVRGPRAVPAVTEDDHLQQNLLPGRHSCSGEDESVCVKRKQTIAVSTVARRCGRAENENSRQGLVCGVQREKKDVQAPSFSRRI